jgi:hypothetical protein
MGKITFMALCEQAFSVQDYELFASANMKNAEELLVAACVVPSSPIFSP